MKQTVEEAYNDYGKIMFGDNKVWNKIAHDSFVAGAEWQARQSMTISATDKKTKSLCAKHHKIKNNG